ncbi:MAG: hypothetical protein A2045_13165 [Rhodocyclales bacterium GWA2_65_20]|nr:MAG: hypothetical protein A2045_13165 [Rhodocyclales bacterium GWA2_65_20]
MAESEASLDAQLELKKRARRRLVGASALALLAAIVLPMVMDHEPRPANQDIQVRIPSQDAGGGFTSRILPTKPAATPLPPAAVAEPKPASEAKAEPKAPAAKVAAVAPAPSVAAKPADKPVEKAAAKPAEKPAENKSEETRAANALAGDGAAEHWVVQLGAYKEGGNVKLLLSKLKEMGVPAYTEKFDSPQGPRTRVRAGPFANREAAEKARAKAKIIGVDGPVAPK